jgi:N-acyl-D-aspartate/D-glutamate deacylase
MGKDSQGRAATADEIGQMRALVREAMDAGAHGISFSMNQGHYDAQGEKIPSVWAQEDELFALCDVLGEMGTGIVQAGSAYTVEEKNRLMSRLSEACGRPVIYIQLAQTAKRPDGWKVHMAMAEEAASKGIRAFPTCSPVVMKARFDMRNTQAFRGVPTWHPILFMNDEDKLRAYADKATRDKLHVEAVEWVADIVGNTTLSRHWPDTISVEQAATPGNRQYEGRTIRELAEMQGKRIIDAFLDLVVEEKLQTRFVQLIRGFDREVMSQILNYPNAYIGLSDAGAHVQFRGGYGYSSELLGYWVRRQKIMTLEQAVKRLTFDLAQGFGIYDRGLLQPGLAADIVIFDPDTIDNLPEEKVYDLPGGAWRMKELAKGVHYTVVNGEVLLEHGRHTGALPGHVLRNNRYQERLQEARTKAQARAA